MSVGHLRDLMCLLRRIVMRAAIAGLPHDRQRCRGIGQYDAS
jgi:hypothetical protein